MWELFTDQIGVKHGWIDTEQGGCSYFHQDSWYWKIDPELGCNCWIPMQEVGKNAIALSVMPRSHIGLGTRTTRILLRRPADVQKNQCEWRRNISTV